MKRHRIFTNNAFIYCSASHSTPIDKMSITKLAFVAKRERIQVWKPVVFSSVLMLHDYARFNVWRHILNGLSVKTNKNDDNKLVVCIIVLFLSFESRNPYIYCHFIHKSNKHNVVETENNYSRQPVNGNAMLCMDSRNWIENISKIVWSKPLSPENSNR